jgi:DUF4097 and DUF4098 domain-containing protein YvlB
MFGSWRIVVVSTGPRRRKSLAFAAALLIAPIPALAASRAAQEEVTRDFQKTVTLGAGQSVSVEHRFGGVRAHGESGRDVKIIVTIRVQAGSRSESQDFADKIQIEVEQTGEGVLIRTVYPDEKRRWFSTGNRTSYSVNYDIAMPADAPLRVRNSFGSIDAAGIHASNDLEDSHGSLTVHDAGPARLNNSFGSVELAGAGGNVTLSDNNGSVNVSDVKGTLELRNRFGSVTARNIQGAATIIGGNGGLELTDSGAATLTNSFGGVTARNIRGDLSVHDNNGNVEISTVSGGADINNSFGNVTFSDVKGRVNLTTNNGRVKGSAPGGGSVTIRDSFGNIELDTIVGALDAETSNGRIILRDARGSVTLKTSFGAIEATNIPKGIRAVSGNGAINLTDIGGDAYARTSFGSILAERVGGNLAAENTNGSVTARGVKGDVSVDTSFAGVTLELIGGKIRVDNQNGGISVLASRPSSGCRDISLKTSFSSIRVAIPEGLGYNVTARTSFGRVNTELPITATGSMGGDSLTGTIGAGGCQLQLSDSNGNIEIVKSR